MAVNDDWVIYNKRSSDIVDDFPKLPQPEQLEYGEIAINYAAGHETISLKNNEDEIATFCTEEKVNKKVEFITKNDSENVFRSKNDIYDWIREHQESQEPLYEENDGALLHYCKTLNDGIFQLTSSTPDYSSLFDPERFVAEAKKNTKKMYWNGIPVVRKKLPARPEGGRRYLFQGGVVMKIKVGGGKIVAFQNGQVEQFARGGAVSQNDDFDTWLDGSVRVFRNKRNSIRNLIVNVTHINGSGIGPTRVLVWVDAPYLFCKTNSNEQSAIQGEGNAEEGTKMVHAHLSIDLGFLNVSLDEKYFSGYSTTSSPNLFLMDGHVVSTKKTRGNDFYDGKVFYRRTPVSWSTLDSHILHSHKDKLCVYYKPKKKMLFGPEWTSEKNRTTRVTAEFCEYSSQGYGLLLTKKYYTNHASVVDWPEHGEITLVFTEKGDSNHTQFTYSVTSFAGETLFITANELLTSGCQNVRALKLDEVIFNDTLVDNGFVTDDVWYNRYVKYPNYVLYRRQKKDGCETVMRKNTFDLILRKRFRGVLCPPIKVWVKDLHYLDMKNEE